MNFVQRKALEWANEIRREHGLAPVTHLSTGMRERPGDCSLARTIAPGHALIDTDVAYVFGEEYRVPFWIRRFIKRFDWDQFHELESVRPSRSRPAIDHLDFDSERLEADTPLGFREPGEARVAGLQ